MSHAADRWLDRCEGAGANAAELAACKDTSKQKRTLETQEEAFTRYRRERTQTPSTRKRQTSTDYTYQIPRLFNPSRDGTFFTGEKNAINFSRSYDAASNS